MAISTRAMLRPRLSSLGEAAAAVLLGSRATTSSSSSLSSSAGGQKRMAIAALHTAAFVRHYNPSTAARAELGKMVALHSTCIANTASLSFHGSLQLFGSRYYASSSTKFGRKAALKRLVSKRAVERKSLGPGKSQKQGRTSKRSVSVLATSRRKVASSMGERQKVASSMGERQKVASSMGERRSERHLASPEKSSFVKTISKTAFRRQEKSQEGYNSRDGTHPRDVGKKTQGRRPVTRPAEGSFPSKDLRTVKKALWNQGKKQGGADSKASTQARDSGSQKKGKRVMRLDPQDKTSKRLFEGYPLPGEEVSQEQSVEPTSRGQFRAITPPPKLMQHIERHMLGRRRPSELQRAGYDMKITPAPLDNIPYSKKGERQPIQEEVFRHKLRFAAAAKIASSFPPADIPEVAFAGRSNVGKSSLINALTRQWGVARTSDKPGLTQSINFFRLGGRLCLVDLPGYGFAYAKEEKKESWEELVREFVTTSRIGLKRVCLLVDAKWGLKLRDEELIELMEKAGTKYQIVLTKSDTVTPIDLARRATQIQEVFKENKSLILPMIMVSSKTGEGLEFFRANVAKLAKASLI